MLAHYQILRKCKSVYYDFFIDFLRKAVIFGDAVIGHSDFSVHFTFGLITILPFSYGQEMI